ncbi:unnamed protein product, partial [Mesorhabditis spiculigera]
MKMAGELEAMAKHEDKDILNGAPLQHDEGEAQGDSNRNFINKKDMPLANARGLLQRADGNLLNIRADDDSIVLQIPGGSRRFLDRNDTYCQAPDF